MKFVLLFNVKMPTIVGILTFMSRIDDWLLLKLTILISTAESDEIAHLMNLHTQYPKTVSRNCKKSVTLLQMHEENILSYIVKIYSARAMTTFSRNF